MNQEEMNLKEFMDRFQTEEAVGSTFSASDGQRDSRARDVDMENISLPVQMLRSSGITNG